MWEEARMFLTYFIHVYQIYGLGTKKSYILKNKKYVDDLEPCPIISETCDKGPCFLCLFRRINKFILL